MSRLYPRVRSLSVRRLGKIVERRDWLTSAVLSISMATVCPISSLFMRERGLTLRAKGLLV